MIQSDLSSHKSIQTLQWPTKTSINPSKNETFLSNTQPKPDPSNLSKSKPASSQVSWFPNHSKCCNSLNSQNLIGFLWKVYTRLFTSDKIGKVKEAENVIPSQHFYIWATLASLFTLHSFISIDLYWTSFG